jgi:ABC-type uncharacterized transport system ATPase subunit
MAYAVEMRGITKRFLDVVANDHVDFRLEKGEICALLGENGAGKTTLMKILYGLYTPDEGEIYVNGQQADINSPGDAIRLGIGMVHQHFALVPPLSVAENIMLGLKSPRGLVLDLESAKKKIEDFSTRYGLTVDPEARVWQLSIGQQQRVEIIKVLYRGAQILILDEPTAVLTPQEVVELFKILRVLKSEGKSVVFISHKLDEVLNIGDRVVILRGGKVVDSKDIAEVNRRDLARMMVGREVLELITRTDVAPGQPVLRVEGLRALGDRGLTALHDVSFEIHEGEILGVAGVSGNGQRELAEVISGVRQATQGTVWILGENLTNCSPRKIIDHGVARIPENRLETGCIAELSVRDNLVLECFHSQPMSTGLFLNHQEIANYVASLIDEYQIKTASQTATVRTLSGGNLQKVILARVLSREPRLIIAAQPTRGLDVGATEYIHQKLLEERERGGAILLISEDLDEILNLSDRIMVMYEGRIMDIVSAQEAKVEEIGLMMAGVKKETEGDR